MAAVNRVELLGVCGIIDRTLDYCESLVRNYDERIRDSRSPALATLKNIRDSLTVTAAILREVSGMLCTGETISTATILSAYHKLEEAYYRLILHLHLPSRVKGLIYEALIRLQRLA